MFTLSQDGSTENEAYDSANTTSTETWTFYCGVYNDTDIRVYKNGVLNTGDAVVPLSYTAGIFDGSSEVRIAAFRGSTVNPLDGEIDDVYVWDTALTATEVLFIYNSKVKGIGKWVQPSNLQLYCALDDCADGASCSSATKCHPGSDMTPANTPVGYAQDILLSYPVDE